MTRRKPRRPPLEAPADWTPPREESEVFSEIAALCVSPGFAHAIAFFCYRDNLVRYNEELTPNDLAHMHTGSQLIRTEISTLIGLLVRHPIDYTLPNPFVVQDYLDRAQALLQELHEAIASVWFKDFDPEKYKAGGVSPFSSGSAMREPIFYGGDSAYNFQYREFAEKKYANDQRWLRTNKGFDIATAMVVANALRRLQVEKQTALPNELKKKPNAEWTALPAFTFSLSELTKKSGLDIEPVRHVIEAFCLPSDNRNTQFTSLQEYNATNAVPILNLGGDEFLLFQHYSLMEALYESPFFWMVADKEYAPKAMSNRGRYTESLAFTFLNKVFGANVHANVHLEKAKGVEIGEIDVLVIFGDRAIVLQAKSKRLTLAARKGNDFLVKDDFKKAIQDSYDQALACSKALIEANCKLRGADGQEISLASPLKQIFPVCIVSDHYPALAFQARQFLKYEATKEIQSPLVTDVFALDAITEMLETPLRVLSYLELRSTHGHKTMSMQELTLLSTHLKYNLWINNEYDFVVFEDDIGVHVDVAMAVRREGVPGVRTPDGIFARIRTTHVGRILSEIESRPDPGIIALGFLLLSLSEDTIGTINKGIDVVTLQTARDGKNHDFTVCFGNSSSGLYLASWLSRLPQLAAERTVRQPEYRPLRLSPRSNTCPETDQPGMPYAHRVSASGRRQGATDLLFSDAGVL